MSRRDTIIIAVLVNAALLMILFATAIRTEDSNDEIQKKINKKSNTRGSSLAVASSSQDELLNEFVTSVPNSADPIGESLYPFEEIELVVAPQPTLPSIVHNSHLSASLNPPHPVEKQNSQWVNITVKKGDFLEKIAKANNTTVAAIMNTSNLSSTQLKIGQVLKVPLTKGDKIPSAPAAPSQHVPSSSGEYYIVKEGDNPWLIASRNKINLEELLRLNGLDDQKAKHLRPGDRLKIR